MGEIVEMNKETEEMRTLEELAEPLVRYLRENYHPYMSVIVQHNQISLSERTLWIPKNDFAD